VEKYISLEQLARQRDDELMNFIFEYVSKALAETQIRHDVPVVTTLHSLLACPLETPKTPLIFTMEDELIAHLHHGR
jgi:hypothetical protein